ncbi:hypothetical protein [Psychrobacillus sp.]|uniref:hypothetical protein n=1 Tax=Psychrobacillus sp. TaxID=1871623 RepID=UPI0028BEDBB5|nr:hypothetical protein [Psychrobacillus sp.]
MLATIFIAPIISVLRSIESILSNALSESSFVVVAATFIHLNDHIHDIGKHLIQGMQPIGVFLQAFKEAANQ